MDAKGSIRANLQGIYVDPNRTNVPMIISHSKGQRMVDLQRESKRLPIDCCIQSEWFIPMKSSDNSFWKVYQQLAKLQLQKQR